MKPLRRRRYLRLLILMLYSVLAVLVGYNSDDFWGAGAIVLAFFLGEAYRAQGPPPPHVVTIDTRRNILTGHQDRDFVLLDMENGTIMTHMNNTMPDRVDVLRGELLTTFHRHTLVNVIDRGAEA